MSGALMGLPRVSPSCMNASEMVDASTLNLLDTPSILTVEIATISWTKMGLKVDPGVDQCCCYLVLRELQGWIKLIESSRVCLFRAGIYCWTSLSKLVNAIEEVCDSAKDLLAQFAWTNRLSATILTLSSPVIHSALSKSSSKRPSVGT